MIDDDMMEAINKFMTVIMERANREQENQIGFAMLVYQQCDTCSGMDINYIGTMEAMVSTGVMEMFTMQINKEMMEKGSHRVN